LSRKGPSRPAFLAAFLGVGQSRSLLCSPKLFELLDDKSQSAQHAKDTTRVCDLAASALEFLHGINHTGIRNVYFNGPIGAREEGIRSWKSLRERYSPTYALWKRQYLDVLFAELTTLLKTELDKESKNRIKEKMLRFPGTTFCLGDLSGVDRVVLNEVHDVWRFTKVLEPSEYGKHFGSWSTLHQRYRSKFLPMAIEKAASNDETAAAFIKWISGQKYFSQIRLWSLCRNFEEEFPESKSLGEVKNVQQAISDSFKENNRQVVLHGRIAVLEPLPRIPRPNKSGGVAMIPSEHTALANLITQFPSDWALHRKAIVQFTATTPEHYHYYTSYSIRYPGNEIPYLANAAYQLRRHKKLREALQWCNKALIINPENPKGYAIRGIIKMKIAGKAFPHRGYDDLLKAFQADPLSLDFEPETHEAVRTLLSRTSARGNRDLASDIWEKTKDIAEFGSETPLKVLHWFKDLRPK
jgi:hypothetical protein